MNTEQAKQMIKTVEMNNKTYQRYRRECRHNGRVDEPSDIDNDGKTITLSNVNGVLARYRIKGNRIYKEAK
jgi:hypothetical protein